MRDSCTMQYRAILLLDRVTTGNVVAVSITRRTLHAMRGFFAASTKHSSGMPFAADPGTILLPSTRITMHRQFLERQWGLPRTLTTAGKRI